MVYWILFLSLKWCEQTNFWTTYTNTKWFFSVFMFSHLDWILALFPLFTLITFILESLEKILIFLRFEKKCPKIFVLFHVIVSHLNVTLDEKIKTNFFQSKNKMTTKQMINLKMSQKLKLSFAFASQILTVEKLRTKGEKYLTVF